VRGTEKRNMAAPSAGALKPAAAVAVEKLGQLAARARGLRQWWASECDGSERGKPDRAIAGGGATSADCQVAGRNINKRPPE